MPHFGAISLFKRAGASFQISQEQIDKDVLEFQEALSDFQSAIVSDAEKFQQALKSRGAALLAMARSLEARRAAIKDLDLSGAISEVLQKTNVKDVIDGLGALQSVSDGLQESSKINSEDIGVFCLSQQKKQISSPVATYDANLKALYLLDSPEQAKSLPSAAAEADAPGKLLASFTTPNLATLLKKGGANDADVERAQNFPFARIRLSLSGRDSGAGAEARLSMKRANGAP